MVKLDKIRFEYAKHAVFENLSLELEPGNIYGLLGLNGAGKSTLLKLLSGMLFPIQGRIEVMNRNPAKRSPSLLSNIYVLCETPYLPRMSDRLYVSRIAPLYPNFDSKYLEHLLTMLAVPRGRKLSSLSLGEQKKFHLAFALACQPSILILDEPTNGLDIPSKGIFRSLVAEALTPERVLIVATHQVKDVEHLIDRILILHGGSLICDMNLHQASAGLVFSQQASRPDDRCENLLYTEPYLGGYASVRIDPDSNSGPPDLELLFKAAIAKPAEFARFARKASSA